MKAHKRFFSMIKNKYIIIIILFVVIVFWVVQRSVIKEKKQYDISNCFEDTSETIQIHEKNNNVDDSQKITKVIFPKDCIYRNIQAGYQIIFPEHWGGNYVVTEYGCNNVCIGFFGVSKTGQMLYEEKFGRSGLDMCWIVTQIPTEGCMLWCELGKIKGESFFMTSPLGGTYLPELEEILKEDSITRKVAKYDVDETELKLAVKDNITATQMRNDLDEMNIKFEPISHWEPIRQFGDGAKIVSFYRFNFVTKTAPSPNWPQYNNPEDMGTYNYAHPDDIAGHTIKDVKPYGAIWIKWGNVP